MKNIRTYLFIVAALQMVMVCCYGQRTDAPRRNLLKVDLSFPAYIPLMARQERVNFRSSIEFEHKFAQQLPFISWVVDLEHRLLEYEFVRLFSYPNGFPGAPQVLDGWTTQSTLGLIAGVRMTQTLWSKKRQNLNCFLEPRAGMEWRSGRLFPNNLFYPSTEADEIGSTFRIRTGLQFLGKRRIGIEASADFYRFKFIGDGHHTWGVYPECNLMFQF